jgi:hypothetical protein
MRCDSSASAAADASVGLILLDVVIGDRLNHRPGAGLVAASRDPRRTRSKPLVVLASITGTDADRRTPAAEEGARGRRIRCSPPRPRGGLAAVLMGARKGSRDERSKAKDVLKARLRPIGSAWTTSSRATSTPARRSPRDFIPPPAAT